MELSEEDRERLVQIAKAEKSDAAVLARALLAILSSLDRDEDYEREQREHRSWRDE